AQVGMRDAPDPRVNLEVALVRLVHPEADDAPAALLARIERLEGSTVAGTGDAPRAASAPTPTANGSPTGAALAARAAAVPTGRPTPAVDPPAEPHEPPAPVAAADQPPPPGPTGSRPTLGALRRRSGSPEPAPEPAPVDPTAQPGPVADVEEHPAVSSVPVAHPSEVSPSTAPSAAAPFPSRDQLVQAWGDHVIGRLRPKAKALYQAGRFIAADGERAQFGLPNEIHRNRCEDMRSEVEAALADQFGRPVPLVLVVDGMSAPPPAAESGGPTGGPGAPPADAAAAADDGGDLADFDADNLEVVEIDNSAEARLLQAFPGAEEVV
ncbi:MAG TPA: hypothetical protein VF320_08775, partial [Acidimicrobiales bacterium]